MSCLLLCIFLIQVSIGLSFLGRRGHIWRVATFERLRPGDYSTRRTCMYPWIHSFIFSTRVLMRPLFKSIKWEFEASEVYCGNSWPWECVLLCGNRRTCRTPNFLIMTMSSKPIAKLTEWTWVFLGRYLLRYEISYDASIVRAWLLELRSFVKPYLIPSKSTNINISESMHFYIIKVYNNSYLVATGSNIDIHSWWPDTIIAVWQLLFTTAWHQSVNNCH